MNQFLYIFQSLLFGRVGERGWKMKRRWSVFQALLKKNNSLTLTLPSFPMTARVFTRIEGISISARQRIRRNSSTFIPLDAFARLDI